MKSKIKLLICCLAIPLSVGAVSGMITHNSMNLYQKLKKPAFSPPGWVFPVVWSVLFVLMGIASYLVITSDRIREKAKAAVSYITQLALNFFWPIFFFKMKWYQFSFFWLVFLWCAVIANIKYFYLTSRKAAYLLIPYVIWITYAGYLNLFIYLLN